MDDQRGSEGLQRHIKEDNAAETPTIHNSADVPLLKNSYRRPNILISKNIHPTTEDQGEGTTVDTVSNILSLHDLPTYY